MEDLEYLRGLVSLPYPSGVAKEMSILEECLLCLGVRGDEGIAISVKKTALWQRGSSMCPLKQLSPLVRYYVLI
jgi:hypothetical protein